MVESEAQVMGEGAAGHATRWRAQGWWPFRKRSAKIRNPAEMRKWIAIWAIVTGLLIGFFDIPRPLDDGFQLVRDLARPHQYDGKTVIVAIDDRSLTELGVRDPLRSDDARLLDKLFEHGANRVVFDRAYADPSALAEDRKLLDALARHKGHVFIGSTPVMNFGFTSSQQLLTHPRFLGSAPMVSIMGYQGPFGFSWRLPTSSEIQGKQRPSISATLAGIDRVGAMYRPDLSIKPSDVPVYSYIDVINGRLSSERFAGKDVVVATANLFSPDRFRMPFVGLVLGSQLHAIGAQTLRERFPIDLGFLPSLLIAALFIWSQSRVRRPLRRHALGIAAILVVAPFALDLASIRVDVTAALVCLLIGWIRLRNLARTTYRGETALLRIEQLHSSRNAASCDVIALKIRNFATISAILSPREIERLLEKLQDRLHAAETKGQFAFDKDTFVWLRDKLPADEREDHLRGLHALFRTSIAVGTHMSDVAVAIGLDANYAQPLRERIEGAIQTAEDAAHNGSLFMIGEDTDDEDRAWRLGFFTELNAAIENGDLDILFQPKINLATGMIVGAEALLRWDHPTRGQIDPARIIQFAEEHNRIDTITRFVLDRALTEARKAIACNPAFKVAVNISALDLRDFGFAREIRDFLTQYDFPPGNLILEITETAPIENDRVAAALLAELKQMGLSLSVDDFGTGHASLHYLRQIPSDEVKIDRSFVSGMMESPEDRTLVRTAIEMIHSLGRVAVAEGVETAAVANLLREMGCDKAQGYYFARAMPMNELLPKLDAGVLAA